MKRNRQDAKSTERAGRREITAEGAENDNKPSATLTPFRQLADAPSLKREQLC